MGFAYVDCQELDLIGITLFQGFQGPKLGPKGASGEAAKYQNHWLRTYQLSQVDCVFALEPSST